VCATRIGRRYEFVQEDHELIALYDYRNILIVNSYAASGMRGFTNVLQAKMQESDFALFF